MVSGKSQTGCTSRPPLSNDNPRVLTRPSLALGLGTQSRNALIVGSPDSFHSSAYPGEISAHPRLSYHRYRLSVLGISQKSHSTERRPCDINSGNFAKLPIVGSQHLPKRVAVGTCMWGLHGRALVEASPEQSRFHADDRLLEAFLLNTLTEARLQVR